MKICAFSAASLLLLLCVSAQKRPPVREEREEQEDARENLVKCRLEGKTPEECRQAFGDASGRGPVDSVRERLEVEKGAPKALLGFLENCTRDANNSVNVTFDDCRQQVKNQLERLKNETVKPEELEDQIRKIAAEKAKMIVEACMESASTDEAKEVCLASPEALAALARLTGRATGSVPPEELRQLFRAGAEEKLSEELTLCLEAATTDEAKRACFSSDDFKDKVGQAMGKGKDDVKDSDVREFLEQGVYDEIWTLLGSCAEADKDECMVAAKELLANVTGKDASEVTDDMIRKVLGEKMAGELGERMSACMDEAADDEAAKERCKATLSADVLGVAGRGGSKTDVEEALKEAGREKAKEIAKDCQGSREECLERIKEEAAKSMGRSASDLSDMEVERLNLEGAKEAAKDAAKGCAAARKESSSATCEDAAEVFAAARKVAIKDDTDKKRIQQELVMDLEQDAMRSCIQEETREAFQECLSGMTEAAEVRQTLFEGLSEERKQGKEKRAKEDAAIGAVGERFQASMEAAANDTDKEACAEEMRGKSVVAGLKEDVEDVLQKFRRSAVATAARSCNATQRAECVKQERAFGVVRTLGEIKAAAETWAACQESSAEANATCDMLAQQELEDLSGDPQIWTNETAAKVKTLGEAMLSGEDIIIRKLQQILVEALTDALSCDEAYLEKIATAVEDAFAQKNASMGRRNATNKECKIVWGLARYYCKISTKGLTENATGELSDAVSADVATTNIDAPRRLGQGRRLAVITDSYADQEAEETTESAADGDGDASGDDGDGDAATSTTTAMSGISTSGVCALRASALLLAALLPAWLANF